MPERDDRAHRLFREKRALAKRERKQYITGFFFDQIKQQIGGSDDAQENDDDTAPAEVESAPIWTRLTNVAKKLGKAEEKQLLVNILLSPKYERDAKIQYTKEVLTMMFPRLEGDKVTFIGLKTDSYETSKNEYRANIVGAKANGSWGYETYQRQKSILNKKGKAKFSLNTGWIAENYNDKIEDLLLAEQVWINKGTSSSSAYPVNIITSNIQEKTDANEKVINYAIEFEYANDIQNNIR